MADSFVCAGATLKCTLGYNTCILKVTSRTVSLAGQPLMATIMDDKPANIPSFGLCHLTDPFPSGCLPVIDKPWIGGKTDCLIGNQPALLRTSQCFCKKGGLITVLDDGQKGENPGIETQPKEEHKVLDKDIIVVVNAYWDFYYGSDFYGLYFGRSYKMKFIPYQKPESLVVEFYYQHDDEIHSKKNLKLIIKNPDGIGNSTKTILINNPVQIGDYKKNGIQRKLYKHVINVFTSDMRYIK